MEQKIGWDVALASLCLAFALSLLLAWTYSVTHAGLSYLRNFTQTVAFAGMVSALIMLVIGDDVARGLAVAGALTVVRFRTTLKDTRDLMFVFASLAGGMACGVRSYLVAIVGVGMFIAAALYFSISEFGSHRQYDAVLRLRMPVESPDQGELFALLRRHCRRFVLVNLRQAGANVQEFAYQVEFSSPTQSGVLLNALHGMPTISGATLLMQDSSIEP